MTLTWKTTSLTLILAAISGTVSADFVGLNIGAGQWRPDITGSFSSANSGSSSVDLVSDLGFGNKTSNSLSISIEHPIPLLPNVKYRGSDLNSTGNSTLNSSLTFDGKTYNAATKISSTLDLSHNDLVLYYQLLDNWVNLDVGLDLKKFNGKVSIRDSSNTLTSSINVDETIPMLYLSARVDLPFTGLYVGANIQQLSVGSNDAKDQTLMIGYESSVGLGVEGGIKTFNLDLNDASNLNTNLKYNGVFVNGYYHF